MAVLTGRQSATTSPVTSETSPTGKTYEGAPGWARDTKSELFLLAVTALAGEDTFYESGAARDARLAGLAGQAAVEDVDWTTRLVGWVRGEGNLRSAATER